MSPKSPKIVHLAFFIFICLIIQLLYGWATNQSITVGESVLQGSGFFNSNWIFGFVWAFISVAMAVAGWLIYDAERTVAREKAFNAFMVQLAINLFWSLSFLVLNSLGLAFFTSFCLWVAVAVTIFYAWHVNGVASILLLPYFLWICFAVGMNFTLWLLSYGKNF